MMHKASHILRARRAVDREIALATPGTQLADVDWNSSDGVTASLKLTHAFQRGLLPGVKRAVKLTSIWNDGGEEMPLDFVKPSETNNRISIYRRHIREVPNA